MRKRAVLKNTNRGQAVTCRLDGPFVGIKGQNGEGKAETLTVLARSEVHVDSEVLRCEDVKRRLVPGGGLVLVREYVPVPGDPPALFDLSR